MNTCTQIFDESYTHTHQSLSDAHNGLGAAIEMTHSRLELSVTNFQKSVELNPNNEPAFFSLIHLKGRICDWREYAQTFEKGMCVLV